MALDLSPDQRTLREGRDEDCEETLRHAYFDPSEDEESGRRHQKPMSAKDVQILLRRQYAQ